MLMDYLTETTIKELIQTKDRLEEIAMDLLKWHHSEVYQIEGFKHLEPVEIDEDDIRFSGEKGNGCGSESCCPSDKFSFSIKTKAIWDSEYRDELKEEEKERERKKKEKIKKRKK